MQMIQELQPGQVCKGIVTTVSDHYLNVELEGGAHGTITSANLSWVRVDHPSQVAQVGQSVTVVFLSADLDRNIISLSLKDIEPDPFIEFARTQLGQIALGKVTKLTAIGIFLRFPSGIEALLPKSEPRNVGLNHAAVGDEFEVKVEYINVHRRQVRVSNPHTSSNSPPSQ
ncbi:S1 RNA-binding domain-containing protein [Streptomyces sp. NBC_01233]|uniref:S1 RNA-binding domain-containing protein n=1 Tax=Streptomyces sp. NBC_01233 TaxID=2903787 RepID=UPI002E0D35A3|nr:S1 RNA-binding domain-containing protein [Streptomyces sp. NBC_01233]